MRYRLLWAAWSLIAIAGAAFGCSPRPASPPPSPAVPAVVLSHNLAFGADRWRAAAVHRFGPAAVVVVCHGDVDTSRGWWVLPDPPLSPLPTQLAAESLRAAFPGRPIVLVTCNPGGFDLARLRGVFYCRRDVVVPPYDADPALAKRWRDRGAGSIWEFSDHE